MKDNQNKRLSPLGVKATIIFVVLNLIFIFGATVLFAGYSKSLKVQQAVDGGVTVEAEIAYLKYSRGSYVLMCRYVDEDGIEYECACGKGTMGNYEQYEKDLRRIGEKVEIYKGGVYYGKGICWAVSYGKDVKAWEQLVAGLVFVFLIFLTFLLLTLYLLWFYDKISFKKKKTEL